MQSKLNENLFVSLVISKVKVPFIYKSENFINFHKTKSKGYMQFVLRLIIDNAQSNGAHVVKWKRLKHYTISYFL